ncbi:type II secretion system F family protein [Proteiniclasticum sp. C24MP]|uniref:type II secretion system F family protein n=1 Tax=Proteiniclasticum sp. C24MP TaxID=3374101 RepID=UPI0037543B92
MKYLVYFLFFLFMTLLFILIYSFLFANRAKTKERMKLIASSWDYADDEDSDEEKEIERDRKRKEKRSILSSYYTKKKKKLMQAYILMKPQEFFMISMSVALIGFLIMLLLTSLVPMALVLGILGFMLPDVYVNRIIRKRSQKLNAQLPEALNIISNGLRAGLSFAQAVSIAGKDLESPIGDEFTKIIRDNTLGKSMENALEDFSERTSDDDIDMFVTAMIIQRQVGGNLSEVLDTISNTIRERVRIKGEVNTLTAQSKLSAIIISFLPVGIALFLAIINPSYIGQLFDNVLGLFMVGSAVFMMLVGIFLLSKLVKLEV